MKNILFFIIILIISCKNVDEGFYPCESEKKITFLLVSSSNKASIISDLNGPFNSETTVIDEAGNKVNWMIGEGLGGGGLFEILLAESGKDSLETLIRKTYYIHLAQGAQTSADIDTLLLWYKIVPQKCDGGIDIKEMNCKYNDSLYVFNHLPTTGSEARFIKKGY